MVPIATSPTPGSSDPTRQGVRSRPLLGLRRQPGRLALFVFRLPLPFYPMRVRMIQLALGVDLRSDEAMRAFISTRPFVALRPTLE